MVTSNPNAVGCLPDWIAFVQQYSYSGAPGENAVKLNERIFNDVYHWGGVGPLQTMNTLVAKYERTTSKTDTNSWLYFFVAVDLF